MARRLSKKKISGWLLLFAVIAFVCCDGHKKVASLFGETFTTVLQKKAKHAPKDIAIDAHLAHRLDSFVEKTYRVGTLGVYVWDETAHKEVYAYNPDTLMSPASNMKMLTCITALRRLGPNHRFESGAYVKGEMKADTLVGDIGLKFTFDPWFNNDSLHRLTSAFAKKGIHRVKGHVIVDLAMREPMQHEPHWTIGDLRLRHVGILYKGEKRMLQEIKYMLHLQGVNFSDSQVVVRTMPKDMKRVGIISTPLNYSLFRALQNSSNEHAECIGFALAGRQTDTEAYRRAATTRLAHFIEKEIHIPADSVSRLHDTSGLCIHDKLSPRFLVTLLRYAHSHKYIFDTLRRCLPVSGMTGTLHDRMTRQIIRGKLQAKTGTLTREDGITSLSGFVKGKNGHLLFFSIIQNEYPVYDARRWQDRFCEQMVK